MLHCGVRAFLLDCRLEVRMDEQLVIALVFPARQEQWVRQEFTQWLLENAAEQGALRPDFRFIPVPAQPCMDASVRRVQGFARFFDFIFICDVGSLDDHGNLLGLALSVDEETRQMMQVGVAAAATCAGDRYLAWNTSTDLDIGSVEKLARTFL